MIGLFEILFAAVLLVSIFSNFFSIPGNLLIAVNSFIYGLITNFAQYSFTFVLTLFAIFLLVEFLEYVLNHC